MRITETSRVAPPIPAPPGLTVRAASSADLPAIVGIYNEAVADQRSTCDLSEVAPGERVSWLYGHTGRYGVWVVAGAGGEVVGWASLSPFTGKECFRDTGMTATYVSRAHRGRGIGRFLRGYVIEQARARGFHSVIARIWAINEPSVTLSREFGFFEAGRLREAVRLGGERFDVILFQKILQDDPEVETLDDRDTSDIR